MALISGVLTVLMMMALLCVSAFAEETVEVRSEDGKLSVAFERGPQGFFGGVFTVTMGEETVEHGGFSCAFLDGSVKDVGNKPLLFFSRMSQGNIPHDACAKIEHCSANCMSCQPINHFSVSKVVEEVSGFNGIASHANPQATRPT